MLRLCSGPRFESWPGSLCCVSLPLSLHVYSSAVLSIKAIKDQKKYASLLVVLGGQEEGSLTFMLRQGFPHALDITTGGSSGI